MAPHCLTLGHLTGKTSKSHFSSESAPHYMLSLLFFFKEEETNQRILSRDINNPNISYRWHRCITNHISVNIYLDSISTIDLSEITSITINNHQTSFIDITDNTKDLTNSERPMIQRFMITKKPHKQSNHNNFHSY